MKSIALTGLPGSGKTTIGKILAGKLGLDFYDLDEYIQSKSGETICQMFEKGEDYFRKKESEYLREFSDKEDIILSLGGGALIKCENIMTLKEFSIVFINRPVENIINDINISQRPLLKEPQQLRDLYNTRIQMYENACCLEVYNGDSPEICADRIIGGLYEEDIDN